MPLLSIRSGLIDILASKKGKFSNFEVKLNIRTTAGKPKISGILQASEDLPEPPKFLPGLASCPLRATFPEVSGLKIKHKHTHTLYFFPLRVLFSVSTTLNATDFFLLLLFFANILKWGF